MIMAGLELAGTTRYPSEAQHQTRLRAGVVELARLADNDGSRAVTRIDSMSSRRA